jgi:hypothetical protein
VEAFPYDTVPRYLVRDRDGIYGYDFTTRVDGLGIHQVPITARSPWQNCYVERIIGSIRRECLNHIIVIIEWHLRRILKYWLAGSFKSAKSDCIIATKAGPHSAAIWLFQSIADFFYLSWHLLRSLFMSQEALEKEIAEMRRQIAELKAEAERADREDKDAGQS